MRPEPSAIRMAAASAASAPHRIHSSIAGDGHPVVAGAGVDEILSVASGQVVVTCHAIQPIIVSVRDDRVVACPAEDEVAAVGGGDMVEAAATPHAIIACAGEDEVR